MTEMHKLMGKARKKWMLSKKSIGIDTTHADGNNYCCGYRAGWRDGRRLNGVK